MKEVEIKILEINKREVIARLLREGARKIFQGTLETVYYDFPNRSLRKNGKVIRLRNEKNGCEMTFKKKMRSSKAKVMQEIEVGVSDYSKIARIFKGIGLKPIFRAKKIRTSYRLGAARFEIDEYPGIPVFLEIETTSVAALSKVMNRMSFKKDQIKHWSTFELFKHYKQKEMS